MAGENFITFDLAQEAIDTKLNFQPKLIERVAPYFLENIRQHLVNEYGESMVYKGGLQVFTTLNRQMQNWAEDALQKGLKDLDKRQGWRGPLRHEDQPTVLPKSPATEIPKYGQILEGVVTQVSKDKATVLVNNLMGTISLKDMLWAKRQLVKGVPVTEAKSFPINSVEQLLQSGDIIEVSLKSIKNKQVRFRLDQTPIVEGAIIAIDPRTGAIRAMVGGYDFERSEFNRALDSLRQPGSAFKPVIYATAIDGGMSPATLVLDAPVVYGQEDPRKTWKPENYEKRFFGPITLREALRHSRNAATVRLLEQVGVREVTNFSRKLGIQSPLNQDLSLALGSSEVTLVDITSAYGIFANQGLSLPPYTISIVRDQEEKILEQHLFKPRQVITKETAYLITHMMIDVIQNGTGKLARKIGRPLAGKTGTTNSYRDAWFVGYAPNLAVGVWVGFDSVETLGKVESGAHAALPIWTQFVSQTFQSLPVQTFAIPEGVRFVEIDQATGTLAKKPNRSTTTEVFAEGAIPHPPVIHTAHPLDFYEFDQLDETEIKNEE
jgi:penicillin-binding protein 1A